MPNNYEIVSESEDGKDVIYLVTKTELRSVDPLILDDPTQLPKDGEKLISSTGKSLMWANETTSLNHGGVGLSLALRVTETLGKFDARRITATKARGA